MKQVFYNSKQLIEVNEATVPSIGTKEILIAVKASLISTGTETAGYNSGGLYSRNINNFSSVKKLINIINNNGIENTYKKLIVKGSELRPTGYSGSGIVVKIGEQIRKYSVGDKVAYIGAPHAEYVAVGENSMARIPDGVSFSEASFGALACIALHGMRLGEPTLGEKAVILGLGLVGMLVAQFARQSGLEVVCLETNEYRRQFAYELGFTTVLDPSSEENITKTISSFNGGYGADVLYLCTGSNNSYITNNALSFCRDKGRVIMIGDMGLNLMRGPLFSKELDFKISRSYGPGRYDTRYENNGIDYPIGYVRWTANRNLKYFLQALCDNKINVRKMISKEVKLENASEAYQQLKNNSSNLLSIVLTYPEKSAEPPSNRQYVLKCNPNKIKKDILNIGIIGCGSFVQQNLLPHFSKLGARVYGVANQTSKAYSLIKTLFSPVIFTTSIDELIDNEQIDGFIIATPHNLHFEQASKLVKKNKPVHVEKPLTLTLSEANILSKLVYENNGLLTIGFNRRFAPTVLSLKNILKNYNIPKHYLYRVNAPLLPFDHWTMDPEIGGGRLIGEGCHFIDLICYLAGSEILKISGGFLGSESEGIPAGDNFSITLCFANGDLGTIIYSGQGNSALSKERIEVFFGGNVLILDDFINLKGYGIKTYFSSLKKTDKGFKGHLNNYFEAIRGKSDLTTTVNDGLRVATIIDAFLNNDNLKI